MQNRPKSIESKQHNIRQSVNYQNVNTNLHLEYSTVPNNQKQQYQTNSLDQFQLIQSPIADGLHYDMDQINNCTQITVMSQFDKDIVTKLDELEKSLPGLGTCLEVKYKHRENISEIHE